jgi:heme A synthase
MKFRIAAGTHRGLRLSTRARRGVYCIFGAAWATGILWLLFHYFMMRQGEFGSEPHPLEAWWLRLHGLCAFVVLWLAGWLWSAHARPAMSRPMRRKSGIVIIAIFLVLAASGYLLYYASDDAVRDIVRFVHWTIGIALIVPILLHSMRRRRANSTRDLSDEQA